MLMVVPDACWPPGFAEQHVLVSSKDLKLCSAWHGADDKKQGQAAAQTMRLVINGHLVQKEDRTRQINAVPPAMADKLAADYDGDEFNLLPVASHER